MRKQIAAALAACLLLCLTACENDKPAVTAPLTEPTTTVADEPTTTESTATTTAEKKTTAKQTTAKTTAKPTTQKTTVKPTTKSTAKKVTTKSTTKKNTVPTITPKTSKTASTAHTHHYDNIGVCSCGNKLHATFVMPSFPLELTTKNVINKKVLMRVDFLSCNISEIYRDENGIDYRMNFLCQKTYDKDGEKNNDYFIANCKIKDENGIVVASLSAGTKTFCVGEKSEASIDIRDLKPGKQYTFEFY